jgi:hypothetical protein
MKYISLAAHNNELIVVDDMSVFTSHFCYSKKQRQGAVDILVLPAIKAEDVEKQIAPIEHEDVEIADEDDL